MKALRALRVIIIFVLLVGLLAACIVEARPDRSMVIYVPPPVLQQDGKPDLTVQYGTIPGTIPEPIAPTLMAEAQRTLAATDPITETTVSTATIVAGNTVAPTSTATLTATTAPTVTLTPTRTTGGTALPGTPATATATFVPTSSGTRVVTPFPTRQATATSRAPATATTTRTPTATRQPTSTATRRPTATPATPVVTATPIPRTVFIGRNQGFMANANYYVVGEVLNGDAYPVFNVKVLGSFYDSSNNLVASEEVATVFHQIEPELSSPFRLQVSNSAGNIDHYDLSLIWDDVSVIDYEELTVESAEADSDAGKVAGELRNDGSVSVQDITVVVTLYDEENQVVDVLSGAVDKPILGTNEVAGYEIMLPADVEFARFEVQAQGALKLF